MKKKEKWYAIYKGDEFIFHGTLQECADYLKVSVNTIYFMSTPTHHKRDTGDRLVAIKVEGDL